MSLINEHDLDLTPRITNTRERRPAHTIQFELDIISQRFADNLRSIKIQFGSAERLKNDADLQYKDIFRSQIVFLESAFDFFMHEITKYGMNKIFQGIWPKTEKYNNIKLRLGDVSEAFLNPEQENLFLNIVNDSYAEATFMSYRSVIEQLKLIGVKWRNVADKVFYEQGSTIPTKDKFKSTLDSLYKRRNQIAHQADYRHETGDRIDIHRETVESYIDHIEKIVNAICDEIKQIDENN